MDNPTRRLLAHLATPRTLRGLSERLRVDPDVGAIDVEGLLSEVEQAGLVVNVGGGDASDVADAVDSHEEAVGFGKGQKKIWRTRAEAGLYDTEGDFYALSKDGLEALKGDDGEGQAGPDLGQGDQEGDAQ